MANTKFSWKLNSKQYTNGKLDIRQEIALTKVNGCSCIGKRPVKFLNFHTFVYLFFCTELTCTSSCHNRCTSQKKIVEKVWKITKVSGCFQAQLHSTDLVNAILYFVSWLCHSWSVENLAFKKLFIIRFSYKNCFQNCDNVYNLSHNIPPVFLKTVNLLSLHGQHYFD